MPLAQRSDLTTGAAAGLLAPSDQARTADRDNISLLRRIHAEPRGKAVSPIPNDRTAPREPPAGSDARRQGDSHSVAIGLIDEVSGIIPILAEENETLRALLKRDRERLEADIERATLVACEWRKSAEAAKLQAENLERRLAEVSERLDRAEARAVSEKELATKSARDAAEAECLSSLFEEKLLSSFGAGSPFQATLDRIRQRAGTEID